MGKLNLFEFEERVEFKFRQDKDELIRLKNHHNQSHRSGTAHDSLCDQQAD